MSTTQPAELEERAGQLADLGAGSHRDREEGMCATEAVAWLAGEPHSDQPACLSPVLARFLRGLNDGLDSAQRQQLKVQLAHCVGTAADGKDEGRRWLVVNWLLHVATPAWLELVGLNGAADALLRLPDLESDADLESVFPVTSAVRADAIAARRAAEARLRSALADSPDDRGAQTIAAAAAAPFYAAAFAAAATDAAIRTSADAAVDASAYLAADAAVYGTQLPAYLDRRSAAWILKAAEQALHVTRDELRTSALQLLERMLDRRTVTAAETPLLTMDERELLETLGARYGLTERVVGSLETLVRSLRNERRLPEKSRLTIVGLIEDSLSGLELEAVRNARRVADLGTGGGIPGLVLAAALPDARFSLVDRDFASISFVAATAEAMGLGNVEAEVTLVEPWAECHRESFDLVVSRNVHPVNVMAGSATVLEPGGRAVLWVGEKGKQDPEFTDPDESIGLRLAETRAVESMGRRRYLFVYERTAARSSAA